MLSEASDKEEQCSSDHLNVLKGVFFAKQAVFCEETKSFFVIPSSNRKPNK